MSDDDRALVVFLDGQDPVALARLKALVDARTATPPPPPADGLKTYRGVSVPNRIQRDRDEKGTYSALFAAWREGVDAALETAAETVVRETRNGTGAPGVSEVWDLFNRHAAKLADHLRSAGRSENR
jgi:hypothetical protein